MLVEALKQLLKPPRTCLPLPCPLAAKAGSPPELGGAGLPSAASPQCGGERVIKMAYEKPAAGE